MKNIVMKERELKQLMDVSLNVHSHKLNRLFFVKEFKSIKMSFKSSKKVLKTKESKNLTIIKKKSYQLRTKNKV